MFYTSYKAWLQSQSPFIIIVSECKQEAEHLMLLLRKPMRMIWDLIITDLSTEACFETL